MSELHGIISPFTTPFDEAGSIDLSLVSGQVEWLLENGVHGLAAGGSTGEGHALNRDEYGALLAETVKVVSGRIPVVAGIIANSTDEVIARGKLVRDLGVAALQITPPSYLFRPDDDSMVRHFQEIHAACGISILIYNVVPWCYLSPDLLLRIMDEVPGVLGVKQSAGDMKLFADLVRRAKPANLIFSAVDALLYPSYQLGAPGSIAAILTAAPGPSVKLWDAVHRQDWDTARDLHERLMPLWDAIGQDNMPSLCKYAQALQGIDVGLSRRPTSPATAEQKEHVRRALAGLGLVPGS
ncbi:dihydrodipicolinate synthase family protein [Hwanghaeella grinnelliae]|uniref:Dihydrodipicolinate synthase family protein n=1 Tax=Hwanghaeella grinnelliae TaxID=2500179 RepID=A0A437QNQ1_9PROT|nr:dihydrodipicolinate synthase family protein [Hwanghaeella grinnelliae]RVU36059.1 dihydrodipicolinate synthase family protein [Hwanghaeella grinnelliae]